MERTIKWLEDHLGITRRAIRNYEDKGLLSPQDSRNPDNNYRIFDEERIDRIWAIRVLQGAGFTVAEIRELVEDPEADFYQAISEKVTELEKKQEDITKSLEYARAIKQTGMIPTAKKAGEIRYADYLAYARENWRQVAEPEAEAVTDVMETMQKLQQARPDELTAADIDKLEASMNSWERQCLLAQAALFQILAGMQPFGYDSDAVQALVAQIYVCFKKIVLPATEGEPVESFTPEFFARYTVAMFLEGSDIGNQNIARFGVAGAEFIAKAVALFGGCASPEEV